MLVLGLMNYYASQDLHPRITHLQRVADSWPIKPTGDDTIRGNATNPRWSKSVPYKRACSDLTEIDSRVSWRSASATVRELRIDVGRGQIFYNIRRLVLVVLADYSNMARARRWNSRPDWLICARKGGGRGCEGRIRREMEMEKGDNLNWNRRNRWKHGCG